MQRDRVSSIRRVKTSVGRFRPKSPYAQRRHDAASTVPSLRSVHPPSPPEVGRRRRREEGVSTKALKHAHRIVRAHIRADEAQWRSLCFLSPSLPPIGAVPGAPPVTHAATHRHAASEKKSAADRPRGRDARRRGCVSSASICAVGSRSRADLHRLARDAYSILRSRAAEHPCERHARRHGCVGVAGR